jgi:pyridoxine 4-dehydrogenase
LIKHIGLSEVSVEDIQKAVEYIEVVSVQNKYSLDDRKWEAELEYCEENDLAFIPWYPLSGGNTSAMATIEKVARKLGVTAHQLALSWLLHHSPNILLIPGTSSMSHLEENLKAEKIELTEETIEELEA